MCDLSSSVSSSTLFSRLDQGGAVWGPFGISLVWCPPPLAAPLIVTCPTSSSLLPPIYLIFPDSTDLPHCLFHGSHLDLKVHPGQNGASQAPGCMCLSLFLQTKVLGCRPRGHFRDSALLHILLEQRCPPTPAQRVQGRPAHRLPARPSLPLLPPPLAHSTDALLSPAQCRLKLILCHPMDRRLTADCPQGS